MRVGVIGVGSMGQNHARVYSEIADLIGVADPDVEVGHAVANRFNIPHFKDHKELLKEELDAVSIATPTKLHFSIAKDVIDAGIHVMVEKPMCTTFEESLKLIEMAREAGVVLAVGHIERHNPVVAFAKTALQRGDYGDVITASARRVSSFPERVRDVGVIMDLGIHEIDVMRYLIGSEVESVYTLGGRQVHERFEDHANILLNFRNGVNGFVEVNWLTPMKVRKLALTCLKNFVELDYTTQSLVISSATLMRYDPFNLYQVPFEYDIRQVSLQKQEPLKRELEDFLDAVRNKREPLVNGEEALETLRIVNAAIESQRVGRKVELD